MHTAAPRPRARKGHPADEDPFADAPVITTRTEAQDFLDGIAEDAWRVVVEVAHLDLVRHLTLADPAITLRRLDLRISRWERPHLRWNGRLGWAPGVTRTEVRYPRSGVGSALVEISFRERTPIATAARAIYPLLAPVQGTPGFGRVEIGTDALPAAGLALLPAAVAPGIAEVPVDHLHGVGLSAAEYGLVGDEERLAELDAVKDEPSRTVFRHPLLVEPHGHLAVTERTQAPLVDLHVHNPVGRLQGWYDPWGHHTLTLSEGRLRFEPTPGSAEHVEPRVQDLDEPLGAEDVRLLRRIESIDLSGLRASDEVEPRLYRRLAELAATGVILHSLPQQLSRAEDVLGKKLSGLVRTPYRPGHGLARELRSVPQRREAMERFGGFFELAGVAEQHGHRLLPTVSAVLSTMRPHRVEAVVEALAAQRYPHLEVIIAIHGDDSQLSPRLEAAVQACGAVVTRHERSKPFGSVLADAARLASGDLVVKIDDDDIYGPQVIGDLVLAHLYSGADMVGKTTEFLYLEDFDHTVHRTFATELYHYQLAGGAMMLSMAALNEIGGWRPTPNSTDRSILIRVGNAGGIGYRTNSLGYVYIRHADGHTWRRDDSSLVSGSYEQWPRFMPEIVDG